MMSTEVGVSFHSPSSDIINNLKHLDILPNQNQPLKNFEYQTNNNFMAEEFYAAATGIYGGNLLCSPRSSMFPRIGVFSPCFPSVPNFHCMGDKFGRICDDDYGGSSSSGFSACGSDFLTTDVETGFSPSALSDLNRTLFGDEEEVLEINNYASILNEFSGEESSALLQNYLFGNSELYVRGGMLTGSFNNQNHLATSLEDHFSNLDRLSLPSLPKSTSSSKPYTVNKLRPSNKTNSSELSATNMRTFYSPMRQLQNRPDYPILDTKIQSNFEANNTRDVRNTMKRSTKMMESSVMKRPRIQTPSPLPTFKVRKEKLGDRITALQQLVSPFGKTDTASVLHESIEYIKLLHDQIHALSAPYMKNGGAHQVHPRKPKLRSRGLCLVPISSAFPVVSETRVDFWMPNIGGAFM